MLSRRSMTQLGTWARLLSPLVLVLTACSSSHPMTSSVADSGASSDAGALPPSDPIARFIPTCGPSDGLALRVFAESTPLACDALPDATTLAPGVPIPSHVEVYLDHPPDPTGVTTYTYTRGPSGIGFSSILRCDGGSGPCVEASEGTIVARSYVAGARLVIAWTATFADGSSDSGTADALYCPRFLGCG